VGSRRCRSGLGSGSPWLSPLRGDDLGAALPVLGWGHRDRLRARMCCSTVSWSFASCLGGASRGSADLSYRPPQVERAPPSKRIGGSVHGALGCFGAPSPGRVGGARGLPTGEPLPRALQGGLGDEEAIRRDSCASGEGSRPPDGRRRLHSELQTQFVSGETTCFELNEGALRGEPATSASARRPCSKHRYSGGIVSAETRL